VAELITLGFDHFGTSYDTTYSVLDKQKPSVITLELSLFEYTGEATLGNMLSVDLKVLSSMERRLHKSMRGGEFQAGYIFAKRNNLSLYAIDLTKVPPEEIVKHVVTKTKNPHKLFPYDNAITKIVENASCQGRNVFMAQVLDLLAGVYPTGLIIHIGGADHASKDNPENATPICELVNNFEKASAQIFCKNI